MKYVFKPGDRGFCDVGSFTVIRGLATRTVDWHDGKYRAQCYVVVFDHTPHRRSYLKRGFANLPKPSRNDMDTKVGWDTLPYQVVQAMKEGPHAGNH